MPHLADAASGPAFCAAAGVLHRAAFGPAEAGPRGAAATRGRAARGNVVVRATAWLRDNL
jgi:cell division protein FtsA